MTIQSHCLLSKEEIEQAYSRIKKYLAPTPVIKSEHFSSKHGRDIFLKLENLQPGHSFKVRGALNAVLSVPEEKRRRGIICASGGNHGLGVALACSKLQVPCKVFLPNYAPKLRVDAIKKLSATIVMHGDNFGDTKKLAVQTAEESDCAFIHPFDDAQVMAGQGTMVLELIEQLDKLDSIIVSIGGGGLISGIISAVEHFSPKTKIIGVETKGADCMALSVQAGHIIELPKITSIADTLGAPRTEQRQFEIVSKYVKELVVVEDQEAISSLLELLSEEKLLVEPASSCSLAALNSEKIQAHLGQRVGVIMCGGNIALDRVCQWLQA